MTFFFDLVQIAARSIRQRGVASLLTVLSMSLGVMLVVAVLTIFGIVDRSFKNNASLGYNMIVGAPKGGREQLTLNTVYYLSQPVENIRNYDFYLEFLKADKRDRELQFSFRAEGLEAQAKADLSMALALSGDATSALAGALIDEARQKQAGRQAELGRDGKYASFAQFCIPLCLGDYYGRFRVVGTTPDMFDTLVYDIENQRKFTFSQGRNFQHKSKEHGFFEAVVGSTVAREMNVNLGDEISPAHGDPEGHTHARKFTVVGILKTSGTPNDRGVFINIEGFYLMEDHAKPLDEEQPAEVKPEKSAKKTEAEEMKEWQQRHLKNKQAEEAAQRLPDPEPLPIEQREVTALLIRTPGVVAPLLENTINEGKEAQAVTPVSVIYGMFEFIVNPIQWTLLLLTIMICIVSGISILVSIYNSMSERRHEIAVMRALGAGKFTVMTIILLESTLLSLSGGLVGWLVGHLACWLASPFVEERTGVTVGFNLWGDPFFQPLREMGMEGDFADKIAMPLEWTLIPGLILLAIIVGIWPAISAYRTDVAKSLGK